MDEIHLHDRDSVSTPLREREIQYLPWMHEITTVDERSLHANVNDNESGRMREILCPTVDVCHLERQSRKTAHEALAMDEAPYLARGRTGRRPAARSASPAASATSRRN